MDRAVLKKITERTLKVGSVGLADPVAWLNTGNYALNRHISGRWDRGIPLGKLTLLAGESGSGKSLIASGNIVREAQKEGFEDIVLFDTEGAFTTEWFEALGVDPSPEKLFYSNANLVEEIASWLVEYVQAYREEYRKLPHEERPKSLIVIDSLGMLVTREDIKKASTGETTAHGHRAKMINSMMRTVIGMLTHTNIGVVVTNHTYKSQDIFVRQDQISGGTTQLFAADIIITMNKKKLRDTDDGALPAGIVSVCEVRKTRHTQPNMKISIEIPYKSGMDPYSGLVESLERDGLLVKSGNRLEWTCPETKEVVRMYRKDFEANAEGILDRIMRTHVWAPRFGYERRDSGE